MPEDTLHINNKALAQNTYDAIVVGSGISGGWAAKELCEKGLKTLVLERGRDVKHITDYTTANLAPWELAHRNGTTQKMREQQPIQSKVFANEGSCHFYVNDKEHPYIQKKPFDWIRGYQVGGRSLIWGRQCYRWSDLDFEANAKDGHGVDWPIRYNDIAPWYSYVEKFVGISGSKEGLPHLPDGEFLPPMEMNCLQQHIAKSMQEHFTDGRRMIVGRVANLTRGWNGRGPCQYRNLCDRGCPYGGYFSSNSATLPVAYNTGLLTLHPHSIVMEVLYDKEKKKATGVRIIDQVTLKTEEFYAKIIFLNASAIASSAILLNSTSDVFPNGMGNGSDQLGRNLMDHHFRVGATGTYDGFQDKYTYGRFPNGIYVPRFRNLDEKTKRTDYLRGFGFQGWGGRGMDWGAEGVGASFKEKVSEPAHWNMFLGGWGEQLPHPDNRVTLSNKEKDKWGIPLLEISCEFRENEKAMRVDMMNSAAEVLEKAGLQNIDPFNDQTSYPGLCIHEMGTARMGNDPKTSVLNKWNQVHEVKNVFNTDGACMSSSACQNPSITYMALTARAANYAVTELKKQNL
jgi:choline dehydrogenase-like flavoprotein